MGQKFYNEADVQAIAAAIRGKNGTQNTYTVSQMAAAVTALPSGASNCKTFTVTVTNEGPGKVILTDADADIAAHRADSSFYVGFVAGFAYNSGLSYRGGLNANHALSDSTTFGFYMRTNSSGANSYGFITKAPTNVNADIGTNANGEIFVYATSTLYLRAGTYTVFCGW